MERIIGQYRAADDDKEAPHLPISGYTTEEDIPFLQADPDDNGPYEIAELRAITALETYIPSGESEDSLG